ncbi:TRUB2 [Mytilus edulis]|uniref:TRUB2 n=1 Tax=Mytilus edulis TaxID=6550 RepID=A0A8S3TFP1_MYTED|nr:TRUB2 [Mytilus edulis]
MPEKVLRQKIQANLARDLNALPCYKYERVKKKSTEYQTKEYSDDLNESFQLQPATEEGHSSYFTPTVTTLPSVCEDISEHRLVLGDRYLPEDFRISYVAGLHHKSSGIVVCGIGSATRNKVPLLKSAQFLRVYHVKGRFGYCTHDFSPDGPLIERTTFHHINKVLVDKVDRYLPEDFRISYMAGLHHKSSGIVDHINKVLVDKVCASIQANHQKQLFEYAGVHPQSNEAYQMACRGLVRPDTSDTPPMIYGVKCIHFDLPDITLEIHAINEESVYLSKIIHDLGLRLKSSAVCPQVRRIRHGHFTVESALLRKDWKLESILDNIKLCEEYTKPDKLVSDFNIEQSSDDVKLLPQVFRVKLVRNLSLRNVI